MGPMGCGKSTIGRLLAKELNWIFEDGDDYHPAANIEKMRGGTPLDDEDRAGWLDILADRIASRLRSRENLVLACSALKQQYRNRLGIDQQQVVSIYLKGSRALLLERIVARKHQYMNNSLLQSQLDSMEEPQDGVTVDIRPAPQAIVAEIIMHLREQQDR
ncbi:MAG: gluconate kinase [Deltaproteobacteria bacterium]|nr:MAG: gluconate kinase [Deltaproteobacteria bacterium]